MKADSLTPSMEHCHPASVRLTSHFEGGKCWHPNKHVQSDKGIESIL